MVLAAGTDGSWYWGHTGWHWTMGLHGLLWALLIAAALFAVVALVRSSTRKGADGGNSALAVLAARYAQGEIDRGEFLERKRDLA